MFQLQVKPMRNFQLEKMMGFWNVVQYYSSTEETAEYKCMRGDLEITDAKEVRSDDLFDTACPQTCSTVFGQLEILKIYLHAFNLFCYTKLCNKHGNWKNPWVITIQCQSY